MPPRISPLPLDALKKDTNDRSPTQGGEGGEEDAAKEKALTARLNTARSALEDKWRKGRTARLKTPKKGAKQVPNGIGDGVAGTDGGSSSSSSSSSSSNGKVGDGPWI